MKSEWIGSACWAVALALLTVCIGGCDMGHRETSAKNACVNNLRQIDGAKQQWAIEGGHSETAVPTWEDIAPFIKGGTRKCYCPKSKAKSCHESYEIRAVNEDPVCKLDPVDDNMD